ncbi:lysosomal cobalamin transporter ABCD4-like, partial [Mixophyes fleayi]|uniref:lysosomal cobalamin transporter ABCD4-like n=1 Tax=Mixophyes fleayi TaxID=3061075 RepID=UPI003F4E2474
MLSCTVYQPQVPSSTSIFYTCFWPPSLPPVLTLPHLPSHRPRLDWIFLCRFLKIQSVLFPRWTSPNTLMLFTLLIVALTGQLMVYQVGILPSQFYGVLSDRDLSSFKNLIVLAVILILVISVLRSTEQYISKLLYVSCRKVMTQHLHRLYFNNQVYYTLSVQHAHVDNPDQRMTQDVERLCRELGTFISKVLTTPFTLVYYTYQCTVRSVYYSYQCTVRSVYYTYQCTVRSVYYSYQCTV